MADLGAGALFGAINTAFKFSEFAIHLAEVGSENNVFVRTIQRVRLDLDETERLLRVPAIKISLSNNPQKLFWIEHAIHSTKCALNDIGLFVERVRSDQDRDDTVSFLNRVRWVLNDHGKLENRRSELATCHQTLATVLSTLHPVEMLASFGPTGPASTMEIPPTYDSVSEVSEFTSPYNRKKRRTKVLKTEIRELKALPDLSAHKTLPSIETTAVPQIYDMMIPEIARQEGRCIAISSGLSTTSTVCDFSQQDGLIPVAEASNEPLSQASDRPRAVTGPNLPEPVNSWELWRDYLERPLFPPYGNCSASPDPHALESPLVEAVLLDESTLVVSRSSMTIGSFELEATQSPTMSESTYRQSCSSTAVQDMTPLSELDGLSIGSRLPVELPTPQIRTRPMSTPLSGSYNSGFVDQPTTRRYTSFQHLDPQIKTMGISNSYKACSKPHIPQLRPGIAQRETSPTQGEAHPPRYRETFPPPHVLPYPVYSFERPHPIPVDRLSPPFCPYPTDSPSMPTELEHYSSPRRATSAAPSSLSDISAVESTGSCSEISGYMHPDSLRPGYQMKRPAVSQSRRRRGLMEAALGVIGEK